MRQRTVPSRCTQHTDTVPTSAFSSITHPCLSQRTTGYMLLFIQSSIWSTPRTTFFFLNNPPPPDIYTLPLHDPLPIFPRVDFYAKGGLPRLQSPPNVTPSPMCLTPFAFPPRRSTNTSWTGAAGVQFKLGSVAVRGE